jgi:hypothetical protein
MNLKNMGIFYCHGFNILQFFCIARLIKTYDYDHVVFCNNVYDLQTIKVIKSASRASRPLILAKTMGVYKT